MGQLLQQRGKALQRFFRTDAGVYILLILTAVVWGGNNTAAKVTLAEVSPVVAAFIRFLGASVLLLALTFMLEGKKAWPKRQDWFALIMLGFVGIFVYNLAFLKGVALSTASKSSLISSIGPVVTTVLSALLLRERIHGLQWAGLLVSLGGVMIIITNGSIDTLLHLQINKGDLYLLAAPVLWSLYTVMGKYITSRNISTLAATAYGSFFGMLMLMPLALRDPGFQTWHLMSSEAAWGMVYMIVLAAVVCFVFWNHGVAQIGPSRSAMFINFIPLSGVLLAVILLGEKVLFTHALGGLITIGGVFLSTLERHSPGVELKSIAKV